MTSRLTDVSQAHLAEQVRRADRDLATLTRQYGELAADATLMGASMLPPPWGTAADVASLGKSLATGDWGGALFDVIGFVPLIGDAAKGLGKGLKVADRMKDLKTAIDAATAALARSKQVLGRGKLDEMARILAQGGDWFAVRKAAAKRYWDDIAAAGQERFNKAIKGCSTQKCLDTAALEKGPHYARTPVSGGKWRPDPRSGRTLGWRGDDLWVPDPKAETGLALAAFNKKFGTQVEGIPYRGGHPDFAPLTVKTPKGKSAQVEIAQSGDNDIDFKNADEALFAATGHTRKSLQEQLEMKLTWHHKEDGVTMQLVPSKVHGSANQVGHVGGGSLVTKPEY